MGTGTAIWLLQVAEELPGAELVGFDNSNAQYPHEYILPSNVQLKIWDVKTPPPKEMEGAFDVVHLRNLLMLVKSNDPTVLIENCGKLLSRFSSP